MKVQDYIHTFENIAYQLREIGHRPDDKHFINISPDMLLQSFSNSFSSPLFILEDYDVVWIRNGDTKIKQINGAFSIVRKHNKITTEQEIEAYQFAERNIEQVLAKLISADSFGHLPGKYLRIEGKNVLPLRNMPVGFYGMRCEITWEIPYDLCVDDELWSDDELPPPPAPTFNLVITDSNNNILSDTIEELQEQIIKVVEFPWGSISGNIEDQNDLVEYIQENSVNSNSNLKILGKLIDAYSSVRGGNHIPTGEPIDGVFAVLIPANTIQVGDIIEVTHYGGKNTSSTTNSQAFFGINTSGEWTSTTNIIARSVANGGGGTRNLPLHRIFAVEPNGLRHIGNTLAFSTELNAPIASGQNFNQLTTVDWNIDNYLILGYQVNEAAPNITFYIKNFFIKRYR